MPNDELLGSLRCAACGAVTTAPIRMPAFDALLAVAWAAVEVEALGNRYPALDHAIGELERLHPDWRAWA